MRNPTQSLPLLAQEEESVVLALRLLGAFSLRVQGHEAQSLSRAAKELLALLVLRGANGAARLWLAGILWPEGTHERVLYYLRRTLSELRAALGPERDRLLAPYTTTLRFDTTGMDCDVSDFDRMVRQNTEADLLQAVALYRGALLENHEAEWIGPERLARAEHYRAALETLAEQREQRGDLSEALRLWQRVIGADSLRESAYRRIMEVYGRLGDAAGIERQYRELRRHLWDELHIEPTAETAALYCTLRARMQSPPAVQNEEGVRPAPAPALRTLPCALTSLIGREAEQQQVHAALQTARMVTLIGPGGVGKTRLALTVGEKESANYPDGVRFADLTPASTDKEVTEAVAAALSLHTEPNITTREALRNYFQPRRLLLILDNGEHVAEAAAVLTSELLRACPNLTILSTSRQPLQVSGEIVLPVAPLAVPEEPTSRSEASDYVKSLPACESVTLLLDRVRAAAPAFRLTPRNAIAIAQICRCLDGLPLALELAATQFRSLAAPEIAARLDAKFRLLAGGDPALPRHRTLYAALDWSYDLLTEAERRLLRHLCVFRGGWTLAAAEAVCPVEEEETVSLLTALVNKSLVVYEPEGGQEERGRYRLLEMTRQYVAERLDATELSALQARHAAFFYAMARIEDDAAPSTRMPKWTLALWLARDNFRAAHAWYLERDAEAALWLEFFLYTANIWLFQNKDDWFARLQAQPMPPTLLGLRVTLIVGTQALWQGHPASESLLQHVVASARLCGEPMYQVYALDGLGVLEEDRGNSRLVLAYTEQALAAVPAQTDLNIVTGLKSKVALEMARLGDVEPALERLQAMIQEGRHSNNWRVYYPALVFLGEVLFEQGDYARARDYRLECVAVAEQFHPSSLPNLWRWLAQTAMKQQNNAEAWCCLEKALAISREQKAPDREGWTLWEMAGFAFEQGDRAGAQAHLNECLVVFQANSEPRSLTLCLVKLARFCAAWDQPLRAVTLLGSAARAFEEHRFTTKAQEREARAELAEELCQILGGEAWHSAWEHGRQMSLPQAVAYAETLTA